MWLCHIDTKYVNFKTKNTLILNLNVIIEGFELDFFCGKIENDFFPLVIETEVRPHFGICLVDGIFVVFVFNF